MGLVRLSGTIFILSDCGSLLHQLILWWVPVQVFVGTHSACYSCVWRSRESRRWIAGLVAVQGSAARGLGNSSWRFHDLASPIGSALGRSRVLGGHTPEGWVRGNAAGRREGGVTMATRCSQLGPQREY